MFNMNASVVDYTTGRSVERTASALDPSAVKILKIHFPPAIGQGDGASLQTDMSTGQLTACGYKNQPITPQNGDYISVQPGQLLGVVQLKVCFMQNMNYDQEYNSIYNETESNCSDSASGYIFFFLFIENTSCSYWEI